MKTIYIFIAALMLSSAAQSQSDIAGIWKLSALKILTLNTDKTFSLKKGAYTHIGEYIVQNNSNSSSLVMQFDTKTIDYEIVYSDATTLQLRDDINNKIINATLLKPLNTIYKNEITESTTVKDEFSESYHNSNSTTSIDSDSKLLVSIYFGGRLSELGHEELVDTTIELTASEMEIEYSQVAGFAGGIKIGYQILDDVLYAGSGFGIASNGFNIKQSLITKNPVYQYDSEITQSAKYTMYGMQIPLWISASPLENKRLSIELGGFLGIPLKQTSKTEFENSEMYTVNGSINDELSSINQDPYVKEYPNIVQNVTLGYSFEIQYFLTKRVGLGFKYQSNQDYMTYDSKKITNRSLGLNLQLRLF